MNSIVRIILRGLLSGEIQPEPQVFEYLRELGEREFQRHSRILRLVQPAEPGIHRETHPVLEEPPLGRSRANAGNSCPSAIPSAPERDSTPHDRSTFASVACGRWIRVNSCLLVSCLVLGWGAVAAQAGISDDVRDHAAVTITESWDAPLSHLHTYGAISALSWVAGWLQPYPQVLPLASGAFLVGLLLYAGYRKFWHEWLFTMRPHEIALQELEAAQYRAEHGRATDLRSAVHDILQKYLRTQNQLSLPDTGPAALAQAVKMSGIPFTPSQRLLFEEVLASSPEGVGGECVLSSELSEKASRFVWATACCRRVKRRHNPR